MAELTTEKKIYVDIKEIEGHATQWSKETKDMQHNTMAKGNEGQATQHNGQQKRKTIVNKTLHRKL